MNVDIIRKLSYYDKYHFKIMMFCTVYSVHTLGLEVVVNSAGSLLSLLLPSNSDPMTLLLANANANSLCKINERPFNNNICSLLIRNVLIWTDCSYPWIGPYQYQ